MMLAINICILLDSFTGFTAHNLCCISEVVFLIILYYNWANEKMLDKEIDKVDKEMWEKQNFNTLAK